MNVFHKRITCEKLAPTTTYLENTYLQDIYTQDTYLQDIHTPIKTLAISNNVKRGQRNNDRLCVHLT